MRTNGPACLRIAWRKAAHAATLLAQLLGQGRALDSRALRSAMEAAFGGTDAEGMTPSYS
jgi:hypothetical protein